MCEIGSALLADRWLALQRFVEVVEWTELEPSIPGAVVATFSPRLNGVLDPVLDPDPLLVLLYELGHPAGASWLVVVHIAGQTRLEGLHIRIGS